MNEILEGMRSVEGYIHCVGRSRGRELMEIQDSCRRISMGCENYEL
jgi:hypothetical protein